MSGFPTRPSRAAFGPTRSDTYPVVDPTRYVAASIFNLEHWQTAGLGVVTPLAWAEILISGADAASLGESSEAWDPAGVYVPAVSKIGVGHYRITYATTYPDELATTVVTNLRWAMATVQSSTFFHSQCVANSAYEMDVYVFDAANAADDPTSFSILVTIW